MLSRYALAVLLVCLVFDAKSDDDDTSQWVKEVAEKSTEDDSELDLTPTNNERVSETACRTDDNRIGDCVPYFQCDPDTYNIIIDGATLIDIRQSQCGSYLTVCCGHGNIISGTETKDTAYSSTALPGQKDTSSSRPLSTTTEYLTESNDERMYTAPTQSYGQCGWNNHSLFTKLKVSSFMPADYGEFPFTVALIRKQNTTVWTQDSYLGGGTLIHPSVVLTVAHKVDKATAEQLKIRAGEWDTQTTKEQYPHQERDVRKIVIHPKFYKTSLYYDAALLFLESPFNLENAPHIQVACIGRSLPAPKTECFGMGWGPDFSDEEKPVTILKKIPLPLVGADDCQEKLRKSRLGPFFKLHKSLTCAGGQEGVDTCQKDGGSPLVCQIDTKDKGTRYAVYGAAAYGIDCGVADRPGVYLKVPEISGWIDQQMDSERYGTASYTV